MARRLLIAMMVGGVLCLPDFSFGQEARTFPLFTFQYELFPSSALTTPLPGNPDLKISPGTFSLAAGIPVPLAGSRTVFVGRVLYDQLRATYDNTVTENYRPEILHALKLQLALVHALSEEWGLRLMIRPGMISDFKNLSSDALSVEGAVMFIVRSNEEFQYGFGAVANTDFGEPKILPAAQFIWTPTDDFRLSIVGPKSLDIQYRATELLEVGIVAEIDGNHYRLGAKDSLQTPTGSFPTEMGRIKYSEVTAGPSIRFHVRPQFSVFVEGGAALKRRFEVFDRDDNKRLDLTPEKGAFFRAGFAIHI